MELVRTEALLGADGLDKLRRSRVIVFGTGGVGGHVIEALVRCGLGAIDIVDNDVVAPSNINRQIISLQSTIGRPKTEVFAERIHDINPGCIVTEHRLFYVPDTADRIDFSLYDYVVDAIDTVSGKIEIVMRAQAAGVPVISSMGTGNKLHPERLMITDIYKTSVCPLARVMRYELKKRGVKKLKVIFSDEVPIKSQLIGENGKPAPGSVSFVPSVAGLMTAGEVIRGLCSTNKA